jgi:DNA repair exonuclease SbcCD nuclease subunit
MAFAPHCSSLSRGCFKLILVSSAPFEDRYAASIHQRRVDRLNAEEKIRFKSLMQRLSSSRSGEDRALSQKLHSIFLKSDFYETGIDGENYGNNIKINSSIFNGVWSSAAELRSSGMLLKRASVIQCPVLAIHGDHDRIRQRELNSPSAELKKFQVYPS